MRAATKFIHNLIDQIRKFVRVDKEDEVITINTFHKLNEHGCKSYPVVAPNLTNVHIQNMIHDVNHINDGKFSNIMQNAPNIYWSASIEQDEQKKKRSAMEAIKNLGANFRGKKRTARGRGV